jgi:hypothetical protein
MSPFANDPFCYPGTDVLINREGIRDQNTLNQFEAQPCGRFNIFAVIVFLLYNQEDVWENVWGQAIPATTGLRGFGARNSNRRAGSPVRPNILLFGIRLRQRDRESLAFYAEHRQIRPGE